jgi:hypothetical protein
LQSIEQFSNYFIAKKNHQIGLISKEGQWLFPPVLEEIREINNDLLVFQKNNLTAIYNLKTKKFMYLENGFDIQN